MSIKSEKESVEVAEVAEAKKSSSGKRSAGAPVRTRVLRTLREAIISGELPPGYRLVEVDLCERLGVSRPSVREALRQLEAERLVRITPYKGPSVASIDWREASEIYEVRVLLEGHAAYLFAERANSRSLSELREALEAFEAAVREGDPAGMLTATASFYDVILRGCENQTIAEVLTGLLARINLLRSRSMSLHGRSKYSAKELRAIYLAIKRGDPQGSREAAVEHVRNAQSAAQLAFGAAAQAVRMSVAGSARPVRS